MNLENSEASGGTFTNLNHFQKTRKNILNQGNHRNNSKNLSKRGSRQRTNLNKPTGSNRKLFGPLSTEKMPNKNARPNGKEMMKIGKLQDSNQTHPEQSQRIVPDNQNTQSLKTNNSFMNSVPEPSTMANSSMVSNSSNATRKLQCTDTNSFEKKLFGNLLKNPDILGFQKLKHKQMKIPKYMLKEHVLFNMSSFEKNNWDAANQQMLTMREQQYTGEPQLLYEEFQEHRKRERKMMENLNLVDKENAKKSLDDAIMFRGSCEDMCPVYERVERLYKNQVSQWEKDPVTKKISGKYAIKTFMRPSGQAPPLPSDVRPPNVLQKTLDYIIEVLIPHLPESQSFVWDRTRSIRQDFTFQNNYSGIESIDCHEKICRIHILSLHVMAGSNDPDYQQQQEVEQLNNALQTLTHMYDDVRSRGGFCPNEPEFRAYELISKIKDTELDRYLQILPDYVLQDKIMQRAMMLRGLIFEGINSFNLFSEFFKAVMDKHSTFLLASLTEIHFNEIRYAAFRSLSKAYHSKAKKLPTVEYLVDTLQYNDVSQLMDTCKLYDLPIVKDKDTGTMLIDVTQLKSAYKSTQKQVYTKAIDRLTNGLSMAHIIKSGCPNSEISLNVPQSVEQVARESFKASRKNTDTIENILIHGGSCHIAKLINTDDIILATQNKIESASNSNIVNTSLLNGNDTTPYSKTIASSWIINKDKSEKSDATVIPEQLFTNRIQEEPYKNSVPDATLSKQPMSVPPALNNITPHTVKLLIDNTNFHKAAMAFVNKVGSDSVKKMAKELVLQELDKEQKKRNSLKKTKVLSRIANDLFVAFMKEQLYLVALEAKAMVFYCRSLKKTTISKILDVARRITEKKKSMKLKALEINNFTQHVSQPFTLTNSVYKQPVQEVMLNPVSKLEIHKIFDNLDPPRNESICFALRAPNSAISRLVLDQFGFFGSTSNEYKSPNGSVLNSEVLPDHFDPKTFFREITTVVIQVGTVEGLDSLKKSTLINCLIKDAKVLKKLVSYLNLFCTKKRFSVIVCYFDVFNHSLSYRDIKTFLGLDHLKSSSVVFGFVRLDTLSRLISNQLLFHKKVHDELMNIVKALWEKNSKDSTLSNTISADSITVVPNKNITLTSSDMSYNTSNQKLKRKFWYIEKLIGTSADRIETKKQRFQNDTSLLKSANTTANDIANVSKPNNSLMLLRKSYRDISMNSIESTIFGITDNIESLNEASRQINDEHKRAELDELSELVESVLKN